MKLRQLRYFAQVAESGSFSQASRILHIAQPALSQHVRRLEEELGVPLLHRTARGVEVTEAGVRLQAHVQRIHEELAEIPDSVRGALSLPRGDVRFGMPGTVSEQLAVPLLQEARARYPDVRIRVVEAMSGYVLDWLRRGEVDLAMIYATADPSGLAYHLAMSEDICLFAHRDHAGALGPHRDAVTLRDLSALPLIVPGPGHGLRELIESNAAAAQTSLTPSFEIDSYNQIKRLVHRGAGFGVLPRMAIDSEVEAGEFIVWPIVEPTITRKVYLAYSTERHLPAAQRAIARLAWSILRDLVQRGQWNAVLADDANGPDPIAGGATPA